VRQSDHPFKWILEPLWSSILGPFFALDASPNFPVLLGLCAPGGDLGPVFGWFSTVHLAVDFTRVWPPGGIGESPASGIGNWSRDFSLDLGGIFQRSGWIRLRISREAR
jgi:hypothetical protein